MPDNEGTALSTAECPICLDSLNNPVATPCGHLSCEECLNTHIEASDDPYKSSCPTCREEFPIVTPDLARVPDKYKPFISSSIRRIYLPGGDGDGAAHELKKELDGLYARITTLMQEKEELVQRRQDALIVLVHHRDGEKAARSQAKATKRELDIMKRDSDNLRHELQATRATVNDRDVLLRARTDEANANRKKYEDIKVKYQSLKARVAMSGGQLKRKSSTMDLLTSSGSSSPDDSSLSRSYNHRVDIVSDRPTMRIPKRPRLNDSAPPLPTDLRGFSGHSNPSVPSGSSSRQLIDISSPIRPGSPMMGTETFASTPRRSISPYRRNEPPVYRPTNMPTARPRGPALSNDIFRIPPPSPDLIFFDGHDHPDERDWLENVEYNPWGLGRNLRSPGLAPRD